MTWNRHLPLTAAAITFATGIAISTQWGWLDIEQRASEERSAVINELAATRAQLEGIVKATFSSTDGLVHLIALQNGITQELFAGMAALAIEKNPQIRNITIAPNDEVHMVYPLAGNEKVLGFRYATLPEQNRTVQLAREAKIPILAGPVKLVQGGRGLIHRYPIFTRQFFSTKESSRYWGTASIVANVDELLKAGGLYAPRQGLRIALRGHDGKGKDGALIDGDSALFSQNPVLASVIIPGGEWQLAAIPENGWMRRELHSSPYFVAGLLNTLLLAGVVGLLARRGRQVRQSNKDLATEIAVRRQTEDALRQEKQRLHTLFECMPDPVWIIEGNCFIDCNEVAHTMLGYPNKGDFLFVHPSNLSPPLQPDGESSFAKAERMMQMAREKGLHRFEWVHTRANGENFPADITLRLISLEGREVIYCIWRDITERKQAEEALRNSETRFRTLFEQAAVGVAQIDTASGRFLAINRKYCEIVGYSEAQMLRMDFADITHPDDLAEDLTNMVRLKSGLIHDFAMEKRYFHQDGRVVWVKLTVSPMWAPGESPERHIAVVEEITERKRIALNLQESEATFRKLFEDSSDPILLIDSSGVFVECNQAALDLLKMQREQFLLLPPAAISPEFQPDGRRSAEAITEMTGLAYSKGLHRFDWTCINADGGEFIVEVSLIPVVIKGQTMLHTSWRDITERKIAAEKIEHLAFYDPLTDLPNRRLLRDRLGQALTSSARHNRYGALMLLDMDDFKTLNDTLGHDVGDQFLVEVARRLQASVREGDTIARQGGDEFVVILEDLNEETLAAIQVESIAVKILRAVSQPYLLDLSSQGGLKTTRSYHCTSSIGITLFQDNSISVDELMKRADTAMYQAKAAGRDSLRFFDPEMQAEITARAALDNDLREALREEHFCLYYQPQVDFAGNWTGAEALVRWQHPRRGMVPPAEFIPQAEVTGLILPLGHWVLETACTQLVAWAKLPDMLHLTLAVNVSARQFRHADFVDQVLTIINRTGADPKKLKLEMTESLLLHDVEDIIAKMIALKAKGVGFSLDDFGTGYSSLSYLKRLPLDQVKIDQSFVRDVLTDSNDATIARTIAALAHSMGLAVIAEGVETEAQRDFLATNGCTAYQGYLFGRPMPVEDFLLGSKATATETPGQLT
jgi:diguanylate cyclase (GGDEF)-like protein/PAS domain S-box-containing protein